MMSDASVLSDVGGFWLLWCDWSGHAESPWRVPRILLGEAGQISQDRWAYELSTETGDLLR